MADVADTEQPAGPPKRLRTWLTGLKLSQLSQIGTLIVLAATAMFGGLDTVNDHVTVGEPGTPFSDGEFTVTVERASLVPEVRTGTRVLHAAEPGQRYLGVVAQLRNDGTVPGVMNRELQLDGQPDAELVGVWRLSEGQPVSALGPGLTDEVAFVWSLPEDALVQGDSVTLRVWTKTFTEMVATYGQGWLPSATDYITVTVPVKVSP